MSSAELVLAMRRYAAANYESSGLDIVHECWSDEDIAEAIQGAQTVLGAKRKLLAAIAPLNDYRADIKAEAF